MIVNETIVPAPSKKEKRALRLMISLGLVAMLFFLYTFFHSSNRGEGILFYMLATTLLYSCLKTLHEWYHYFSISIPPEPVAVEEYTVDVLTTFCSGEPYDMLGQTLAAAQRIRYPHTTWCCDEEDDPRVAELCRLYGARHITRTEKKNAKAGNINNALQYATGALTVVLDPDHVPAPGFLDKVVPYFNDPGVGFVQVVQAYYNHHETLVAKGAAQQTYQFYGPMMMSMHAYGTVQAIGANCTFRRAAIDSIGGHAAGLAEDMNTAMHLHAVGWKSVYLPAVLTRGLVPATLSAYYKQQLKWSRGTFELLFTSFPKLFTKFTWRQKLHYFTLPFHYLCGFIFLLNFLIPVCSLFSGRIPLSMDIGAFLVAAGPLIWMTLLIRHYVQKWVAEETERGFHVVGGLLQIGTWWVHLTGLLYTIFRKKVPYIPTPKDDSARTPLKLHLPNIVVILISLLAILYGLWFGLNPYTRFMALLAGLNIFFMLFVIRISGRTPLLLSTFAPGRKLKRFFWITRHWLYAQLRRYAIFLSVGILLISILCYNVIHNEDVFVADEKLAGNDIYIALEWKYHHGLMGDTHEKYSPAIFSFSESLSSCNFNLPEKEMKEAYKAGVIPMLRLLLPGSQGFSDSLLAGAYDDGILNPFATRLKTLGPLFISLNLERPGSVERIATSIELQQTKKKVWIYMHQFLQKEGVFDLAWVWEINGLEKMEEEFPGYAYADWLHVPFNGLDELPPGEKGEQLLVERYRKFSATRLFTSGFPVMFSGLDAMAGNVADAELLVKMIRNSFPEVKCLLLNKQIDWGNEKHSFARFHVSPDTVMSGVSAPNMPFRWKDTLRGVGYDNGFYWFRNKHELSRKALSLDIAAMRRLNINAVMRPMPGAYDHALLQELNQAQMSLVVKNAAAFTPEDVLDEKVMQKEKTRILELVRTIKDEKSVVAWNLGEDMIHVMEYLFPAPELFYYRTQYTNWLAQVCIEIRKLDSARPIGIEVRWNSRGRARIDLLKKRVPLLNTYFLVADSSMKSAIRFPLPEGGVWGALPATQLNNAPTAPVYFLPAWQDQEAANNLSLDGLLDLEGRKKTFYDIVAGEWGAQRSDKKTLPAVKILKPADVVGENYVLTYHALIKDDSGEWQLYTGMPENMQFEWFLIMTDRLGRFRYMKPLGKGSSVSVTIPPGHQRCRLYLRAILNGKVSEAISTLNIPLY